ncbi:MAG: 2-oxoacid:acceptor oxidoreductase subunit alpha [Deltaproteobacteria bacterium]|nr:2-oxoacid:acceptor oxidoreductase subunit alpha [Deltaproteobacteria bacterium]
MTEKDPTVPAQIRQVPADTIEHVVVRFAGDSGDGMQLTGTEFTKSAAIAGNDLATFPDYPAEIRAPAGTLAGVSGYQVHFSSNEVFTSGDEPDVLVVMNPAALKVNLADLTVGGVVIINSGTFTDQNIAKAGYSSNPLSDGTLAKYQVFNIDINKAVQTALEGSGLSAKEIQRCKNYYALGLMFWLYSRPTQPEIDAINQKFKKNELFAKANVSAFNAGYNYGETTEMFVSRFVVPRAELEPGIYRHITGNEATAIGLVAAAQRAGLPLFYGSYPITPASDILHALSSYRNYGVVTFQAEDEIAAVASALGAAFAGSIAVTGTSGPGVALKQEAIGLAVMTELPLIIINVQRGGPSTGLPTKTEQADLHQAMIGRNGESPICVIAPSTPADCFTMAFEAIRLATKYMCPVMLLSDGYLANGAEPWKLPEIDTLPRIPVKFHTEVEGFYPYRRDAVTLARPWAIPGTPGLEHRIGGLEKQDVTGNVCYDAANHEHMCLLRQEKINRIVADIPPVEVFGDESGDVLVVGWGSTYGAITHAVKMLRQRGEKVSSVHLKYLNPFPANLGTVLARFKKVVVAEMNLGQLVWHLRAKYLVDAIAVTKIQGRPFKVQEIVVRVEEILGAKRPAYAVADAE